MHLTYLVQMNDGDWVRKTHLKYDYYYILTYCTVV